MTLSPDDEALAQRLRDEIRRRETADGFQTWLDHEAGRPTPAPPPAKVWPQTDDQLALDLGEAS